MTSFPAEPRYTDQKTDGDSDPDVIRNKVRDYFSDGICYNKNS